MEDYTPTPNQYFLCYNKGENWKVTISYRGPSSKAGHKHSLLHLGNLMMNRKASNHMKIWNERVLWIYFYFFFFLWGRGWKNPYKSFRLILEVKFIDIIIYNRLTIYKWAIILNKFKWANESGMNMSILKMQQTDWSINTVQKQHKDKRTKFYVKNK